MNGYEAFGLTAERISDPIIIGGRNDFGDDDLEATRKQNVADVVAKLQPQRTDSLLDIGCGVGFILTPLAAYVDQAIGLDHQALLRRYANLGVPPNVQLIGGHWPETQVSGTFDRILAYSVLHYLSGKAEAKEFIQQCINILKPGGRILLGEIPNTNLAARFKQSRFGQTFEQSWQLRKTKLSQEHRVRNDIFTQTENNASYLTDDWVLEILALARRQGLESYVLPQPEGLPFCYSREDIVLWRRD